MAQKDPTKYFDPEKRVFKLPKGTKYDPSWLPILQNLTALGCSLEEIGLAMGYEGDPRAFVKNLQAGHEEARTAIESGRSLANMQMIAQALKSAIGYKYQDEMIEYRYQTDPETGEVFEIPIKKKVFNKTKPGDDNLLKFLMCNRMPDLFKEVQKIEVDKKELTITATAELNADHIARLAGELGKALEARQFVESREVNVRPSDETIEPKGILPLDSEGLGE